jgi:hypothetical protein
MVTNSVDLAIRLRRAAFNRALAEADLGAIGAILAPTAILVAGTDSAILNGRKAQIAAWKREFAAAGRTLYTRMPETIQASAVAPVAFEQGRWQGVSAASASPLASGIYTAKWRKSGADWVIEAEIFLTLV